jgi:hypothetical protein
MMVTGRTRIKRSILALAISFAATLFGMSSAVASSWPDRNCMKADYWLEFSELRLCVERERIIHLNHLNLSSPSLSILMEFDGKHVEVGFSRLDDRKVTGGLHEHLQVTPKQLFVLLMESGGNDDRIGLIRRVMDVDENTQLTSYADNGLNAFVIVKDDGGYSSIYLIHEGRDGAILLAGMFDEHDAEYLLSRISW